MLTFFTVSFTQELPDKRQIEEFLFEGNAYNSGSELQTTQNPVQYGGPIFHIPTAVARILKAARKDARFTGKHMSVRPIGERRDPLAPEQLILLQRDELYKVLDSEELKVLGIT